MRRSILLAVATAACVALLGSASLGQPTKVFFTETQFGPPLTYRMNLDGSGKEQLGNIPASDFLPQGLALSPAGDKLYYTNRNGGFGAVHRIDFAGGNRETLVPGLTDPNGLNVDWANDKMYFTDRGTKIIFRANTDGSGIQQIITGNDLVERADLDLVNGKIYFGNSTQNRIERANLDGSNRETIIGAPSVDRPGAVAVDVAGGKVYWVDNAVQTNYVARANLDGTGFEILVDYPSAVSGLLDIDLDVPSGKVFWIDTTPAAEEGVWSADLDGSNATRIHVTPSGLTPTALLVTADPNSVLPCAAGNVDVGGSGSPVDILFVNGSSGGPLREVTVTDGEEILSTIVKPPAGGNGRFVIHGILGRPTEQTVTPLPRNIGDTCFPVLLRDGANPVIIANAAGRPNIVGASSFFGTPTPDPPRAPSTILQRTSDPNLPPGTVVSLQGAIFDPGSAAPRGVSIVNMVTFIVI